MRHRDYSYLESPESLYDAERAALIIATPLICFADYKLMA
jgi:hypothetical protein